MIQYRHPDFPPERPHFPTADAYLDHVRHARSRLQAPWPPATVDELRALAAEHPELAKRFIPQRHILRQIGLPHLGKPVRPWSEHTQERLLATLVADLDFATAVANVLGVRK